MLDPSSLTILWIVWGAITVVFVALLIYRSLIGMKEEDQIFLDPAEASLEKRAAGNREAHSTPVPVCQGIRFRIGRLPDRHRGPLHVPCSEGVVSEIELARTCAVPTPDR